MSRHTQLAIFAALIAWQTYANRACPAVLVSGEGDRDAITVSFRNVGKLPIQRIEFNCQPLHVQTHKTNRCREDNALFFPATQYTVRYPYPDGKPGPVRMSVKSATLSDGSFWKASEHQSCGTLRIYPRRTNK